MGTDARSAVAGVLALFLCACPGPAARPDPDAGVTTDPEVSGPAGSPLPGLSAAGLARFQAGFVRFNAVPSLGEGFGPLYNGHACSQCHGVPAIGGQGGVPVTRAGYLLADGGFEPVPGGSLVSAFSIDASKGRAVLPADATVVAHRRTLPLFGAGLLEAVADSTLEERAAVVKPYGIHGRVAHVTDPVTGLLRAGRFGWKAAHATVLSFTAAATRDELGLTNPFFPDELAPNGDLAALATLDSVADPELTPDTLAVFADYPRLLAAPERGELGAPVTAGERVFANVGCGECHLPALTTGESSEPRLAHRVFAPYSDLLLHDLGIPDGVPQGDASGAEIRTPPLFGLRFRTELLHDGSATNLSAALAQHGGEAAEVRDRYLALPESERADLFAFLGSL